MSQTPLLLSLASARRIALAAQGFGSERSPSTNRHEGRSAVERVIGQIGVVQIDSVNVVARSHYLPFYSRLGNYDRTLVDQGRDEAPRALVEYWAHAASLIAPGILPLLRWRMARARDEAWGGMRQAEQDYPGLSEIILCELRLRGPMTAVEVEQVVSHDAPRDRTHWGWNWSAVKKLLELMFWAGEVTSAGRTPQFTRRYDLPERVWPASVLTKTPTEGQAHRELIGIAARACGVATENTLTDYFRLKPAPARVAIASLVNDGELIPTRVSGWARPAYLHATAQRPRSLHARALISPFDSLVWDRARMSALFGMDYRIEIYVPQAKRRHGYYVLPFLSGDTLTARIDLKADRHTAGGVLRVLAALPEPDAPATTAGDLAEELRRMAAWLNLAVVHVEARGDFASALITQLRR
ncbi:MAG: winged helix-turn-helix domain-containing protein [Actinomycetota bacterium]